MEDEKIISGYCRQLDSSRMVEVILENGEITEVDCCYGSCLYQSNCPIARDIDALNKKNTGLFFRPVFLFSQAALATVFAR